MTVKATREGLVGSKTATGYVIDTHTPFVALPSTKALYRFIHISNPVNGRACFAIVLDVGPWNEHDDDYVFLGERPAAERGISVSGKGTNSAGIDLSQAVWNALGMTDNAQVAWRFLE
jgi:hypothetical protein